MCKKKSSSTTVEPPLTPPCPTIDQPSESVDPENIEAILRAIAPLQIGEQEKALNLIKDSIFCYPLSGQLHYTEGWIHLTIANNAAVDDEAKVKHLEDGVRSAQLAVKLLPDSLHCARLLIDLVYELAFFNQEWGKVIEACKHGLKIAYGTKELFGGDVSDKSRIEDENQTIITRLQDAEQKNLEFTAKKAVEVVKTEDKEKEDTEVDINDVVMAMGRRKKQLKAITKKLKDNNEDVLKYKCFWNITLSDEKKRGFRKVNIEELESHFKSLKYQLAVDLLLEAIDFAKQHKTWKFWECYDCVKKFRDCKSYSDHFLEVHWMGNNNMLLWSYDNEILEESIDMLVNGVWKPVDTNEMRKLMVNSLKSEKGLFECKSSSVEEVPGKIRKSEYNESSKMSVDDPKWLFCDDIERSEILGRIRSIFGLLYKNNCLAPILVQWAIDFTMDQFETIIPLSQFSNLGLDTLQIICFLGASKLTELLTFLEDVAHTCGLSEYVEIDNSMGDKCSGHHVIDIKERVLFSRELSCLLLDERVLRREITVTNYFDEVAGDGSAVSFSADECEDDVLPDRDDIVSWLFMCSNCVEGLDSWKSLRESRRSQALKSHGAFLEKLSVLPNICARNAEISSKLTALQAVGCLFLQEIGKKEKSQEHEPKLYMDFLKKCQKELQEIEDNSKRNELDVISEVLDKAQEISSRDQSLFEGCGVEDESRMLEYTKQRNSCIKAMRRLKMQLSKELCFHDTIILQKTNAFKQYELELANITVCDYRSIVVPMLKSFLQSRLNDLYEDAKEKSKAAEKALLAEVALGAEKKISKGFDNVTKTQDKKKKRRNKNIRKTKESKVTNQATDAGKNFQLHQNDDETLSTELGVSGNVEEFERQISIEERMLENNLEYQRLIENEAKKKCLNNKDRKMSGSIGENASECVSVSESCNDVRQTQDKKKKKKKNKKNFRKAKESKETDGGEQFQLCQDNVSPDAKLGDSVTVDEMKNLTTNEGMLYEIEDGAKKKCLEGKNDVARESIGENVVEGVYVIHLKHIDDDEYEKRFQSDIEKAVCLSLGSLKKEYGLLLSTDAKEETTSRLDVHLYVIIQSLWRLRVFRDEFMSRSQIRHTHAGDPCFVCAYGDTYASIRIATRDMPGEIFVPFSSKKLRPVYDFFKEWLNLENPVDAEIGVSTIAYELKHYLVAVVKKIVEDLEHERQLTNQAKQKNDYCRD